MPAAFEYDPDEIEKLVEKERKMRGEYIAGAWKYYRGDHRKPLKVKPGQTDDNVIVNLSKILIDRGVATLFGRGLEWNIDGTENEQSDRELFLEMVWSGASKQSGTKQLKLNDIALNGYVTGQPVVRILPGDDMRLPRIVNLDPAMVCAFWRPDDIDQVIWYSIFWNENARQDIVNRGDVWEIRDYVKERRWRLANEEMWAWDWSPVFTWKNLPNPNEFYGISDIDHADLNDQINFIASNTNRILQRHAHPRTIVRGAQLNEIVTDQVGGIITIQRGPSEVAVDNLEMQSDLSASMQFLQELQTLFFSLGASVDITTIKDRLGQITNFGLRVLFKDALDRLIIKRALYGDALVEINRRLLEMSNQPLGEDDTIDLLWPDPLPMNQLEEIEAVERKSDLGIISKESAAKSLGIDWDRELERLDDEAGSQDIGAQILQNFAFNRGANGQ